MLSLWANVEPDDVARYAASLVLPSYLSHLCLQPVSFVDQPPNRDGHEPLRLTYRGEGRLEHHLLSPDEHALGLLREVCSGIDVARIHLPRDDARWHWTAGPDEPPRMRIYFAPTAATLPEMTPAHPSDDAYVSVSRGHAFVGRPVVEAYLSGWLARLGIDAGPIRCDFDPPDGGVEFTGNRVGGQLLLSDGTTAIDLVRFAGLESALKDVGDFAALELDEADAVSTDDDAEGVFLGLQRLRS